MRSDQSKRLPVPDDHSNEVRRMCVSLCHTVCNSERSVGVLLSDAVGKCVNRVFARQSDRCLDVLDGDLRTR